MATLGVTMLSLADRLKRENPDHSIAAIVEILAETNEIMGDAITVEGNLPTGHRSTVRTGLPAGTWRQLYQGVVPAKSTTAQVDDTTGMLEAYSEVDKSLADLNGNSSEFRLSEAMAFLEGMNQDFANAFFYGDTAATPEKFMGLDKRYSTFSADKTETGYNIIKHGGSGGDNTSVWFVTWGEQQLHLIYPKGSMMGLSHQDLGEQTLGDSTTGYYQGYRDHFKWDVGLVLRDWRGTARLANIDVSIIKDGTGLTLLIDNMIDCYYKVRKRPGRKVIYCNETIMAALHKGAKAESNVQLSLSEFEGRPVVNFLGIPIRECEAITEVEPTVP